MSGEMGSLEYSTKFRDLATDIVTETIDRERPGPRLARVKSYNRASGVAEVILLGETGSIKCRFFASVQPVTSSDQSFDSDLDRGDVVRVEGPRGNRYITEVVSGGNFSPPHGQFAMVGGGKITWTGTRLTWSDALRINGMGRGVHSAWGYFECAAPADGTVITTYGSGDVTSTTVDSAGVPLSGNQALYWEPKWGGSWNAGGTFYLADPLDTAYIVPKHWYLIAQRTDQAGCPSLKLGTGEMIDHWRTPTLLNNWANFGSDGHAVAGYRLEDGRSVRLKGLLKNATAANTDTNMFILPVGYRPAERLVFMVPDTSNTLMHRVDIYNTGEINMYGHPASVVTYTSLSQISFNPS